MRLALSQLFIGVARHSQNSDSRITLRRASSSDRLELIVSAPGIALDATQLNSILEPFQRFAKSDSSVPGGLGLALVQRIVSLHGATLMSPATRAVCS